MGTVNSRLNGLRESFHCKLKEDMSIETTNPKLNKNSCIQARKIGLM